MLGGGAAAAAGTGMGDNKGLGRHWAHAGIFGLGDSGGGGGGAGEGAILARARSFRSALLCTILQPGLAGATTAPSSSGAGGGGASSGWSSFGFHSGEYSPPAPCLDLTLMSSAISYWSWRRSSLNFPTSARRMRTSPARALLKSFKYFGGAPL